MMTTETLELKVNIINLFEELNKINTTEAKELADYIKYELETEE
ncbi:hypothetical protein PXD04_10215 [Methanosphaera sp. ISO3-F5]|nr:hypothetical protein [Methanosphaera sp. ISO3-F5]WQH64064.1 hypothetical protein PXD04_10215 [Methanosphaera sp. ISO3-F5]